MIQSQTPYKSFEFIYKELGTPLTKFIAKRMGASDKNVEEIFSATFIAAWKGFKAFRHKSSYFTWLCRIALNKIADYYRGQVNKNSKIIYPTLKGFANLESGEISLEEKLALEELRDSVNGCLNLLPYEKRKLLHLRYWKQLSLSEIAKIIKTSERAVEGRLYRARVEFAKEWGRKYYL